VRLRMAAAAVAETDGFVIDSREFDRTGPSYTIDTLLSLRRDYPGHTLCLLLGLDAFAEIDTWHDWKSIFGVAHVIVARRPGARVPDTGRVGEMLRERRTELFADLQQANCGCIFVTDVTQLDISSTDLRASIAAGMRPVYLLPDSVWQVILEARCYGA